MKAEKIILSFVAVLIGLIAAGVAFYIYQMTRVVPPTQNKTIASVSVSPSPTPDNGDFLNIDQPADESVSSNQTIQVSGQVSKGSTVIISTETADDVVTPSANGNFSTTESIPQGTSLIQFVAVFPSGTQEKIVRTVTFTTDQF